MGVLQFLGGSHLVFSTSLYIVFGLIVFFFGVQSRALGPTVFASNQLNTPACSFFKQTMSILLKTTRYMTFLRDLEVPDLIF